MADFIEKARQGRVAALAALNASTRANPSGTGVGMRFRSGERHTNVVFFSSRSSRPDGTLLG